MCSHVARWGWHFCWGRGAGKNRRPSKFTHFFLCLFPLSSPSLLYKFKRSFIVSHYLSPTLIGSQVPSGVRRCCPGTQGLASRFIGASSPAKNRYNRKINPDLPIAAQKNMDEEKIAAMGRHNTASRPVGTKKKNTPATQAL